MTKSNNVFVLMFCFVTNILQNCHSAPSDVFKTIVKAAKKQTQHHVLYDGTYRRIAYPMGDVPKNRGVCTDVVIRAYRAVGIDLQALVHNDMKKNPGCYPKNWGTKKPDPNIDHRRVPNLQVFFSRKGKSLPLSQNPDDYKAGDIITWNLSPHGCIPHIGIVTDRVSSSGIPMVVHNIGEGPKIYNDLFDHTITGHYRYPHTSMKKSPSTP